MGERIDYLIVGGGLAGAMAADGLVRGGASGRIALVSADNYPPYNRPPLSKGFLLDRFPRESIFVKKEPFYRKNNIELILDTRITSLDPIDRVVRANGKTLEFDKVLIASGANPRVLKVPGWNLGEIYYLRSLIDSEYLKQVMTSANRAVVVGVGFIGLELAAAFAQKGIEVTMVDVVHRLFEKFAVPEVSAFFEKCYADHGVRIIFEDAVAEYRGTDRVEAVLTKNGLVLPCDFAAVGVGVTPEISFLEGSELETGNGILVDEYLQTNVEGIYAAGDVANFLDPIYGRRRRVEHWDNALKQGKLAARNMLGERIAFESVSRFFSEIFDLTFEFVGDSSEADETILRGSIEEQSFSVLYLKDDILQATFLLGREPAEREAAEKLIFQKVDLRPYRGRLRDSTFALENALSH
jgi:NADPH-dependent 2,4-dienoyl-CoA reductase/sulfur reductase-like enzyme